MFITGTVRGFDTTPHYIHIREDQIVACFQVLSRDGSKATEIRTKDSKEYVIREKIIVNQYGNLQAVQFLNS